MVALLPTYRCFLSSGPERSRRDPRRQAWLWLLPLTLWLAASSARAGLFQDGDVLMIQAAPDTIHFHPDSEHAKYSWLIGLEWQAPSRWVAGAAYFNNSFDQKSQYLYAGKFWTLDAISDRPFMKDFYFKLTGGVVLGYKDRYEDKIPFNHNGIAPGIIPALGYKFGDFNIQANLLGDAGLMFTFGYDLLK